MTKQFGFGLVVGKFDPYHKGHEYVIQTACEQCRNVVILVVDSNEDCFPAQRRLNWIMQSPLPVSGYTIPDIYDDDNSQAWAEHTLRFLLDNCLYAFEVPHRAVFTSETYGEAYAQHMGFTHVSVDPERIHIPVSATAVRDDIFGNWEYIPDATRTSVYTRVVVMGAESTGTSTVAKELSQTMRAPLALEYGRFYTEGMVDLHSHTWRDEEFFHIAFTQRFMERNLAVYDSSGFVICDTDDIATAVFQDFYMPEVQRRISPEYLDYQQRSLYLVTSPEGVPFVQDGLRKDEELRQQMHEAFIKELEDYSMSYAVLTGSHEQRMQLAIYLTSEFLAQFSYERGNLTVI